MNPKKIFLLFLLFLTTVAVTLAKPLVLHLDAKGDSLLITAEYDSKATSYQVDGLSDLEKLYDLLERGKARQEKIEPGLEKWGSQVWGPVESLVQSCSEIHVIIPESLLKPPLDLLYFNKEPLFLQKPIWYSFSELDLPAWQFSQNLTALLISDKSADPDRGVLFLKELIPSAEYFDISEMTLSRLASFQQKDLLLISAHGDISFDKDDYIELRKKEKIKPPHLSRLAPQLVYLDSCQLGASRSFIKAFQTAGTTWYVAPIISNEDGNSSTKTIKFFFQGLQDGLTPTMALFQARIKLYKQFQETDSFKSLLERSFPFRIYQLN
jgi:hypothetical protein